MSAAISFCSGLAAHPVEIKNMNFTFCWLESLDEVLIGYADEHDCYNEQWQLGRVFDDRGEYRWGADKQSIHGVLTLHQSSLPAPFSENQHRVKRLSDKTQLLLGEWIDPAQDPKSNPNGMAIYYTPTIPNPLHYPIKGAAPGLVSLTVSIFVADDIDGEFHCCRSLNKHGKTNVDP